MSRLITVGLVAFILSPLGCYATAGAYVGADYVEADDAPVNVEAYPSYAYDDHPVYLVNDRWYFRHGDDWVYYRQEPVELQRRRATLASAPPARVVERHEAAEQRAGERHEAAGERAAEHRDAAEEKAAEHHDAAEERADQHREAHEEKPTARRQAEEKKAEERR